MEKQTVLDQSELADKAKQFMPGGDKLGRPLVSLIVTNYNYARFIEDCLASICAQTYRNIECIIVDDVSTDNSLEVIKDFIASEPLAADFNLLALEKNGGQMNAFIEGFKQASGAFVVFVDADDFLFADFVETHLAAHLNAHRPAGISCSNEVIVDGENILIGNSLEKWAWNEARPEKLEKGSATRTLPIGGWRETLIGGEMAAPDKPAAPLLFVGHDDNFRREWIWSTTSAIMFRRGVLEAILVPEVRDIRICADFYLLQFGHMIGGTLLIQTAHGAYRRHGTNNFAVSASIGSATPRGAVRKDVSFEQITAQMLTELLKRYEMYVSLVGEPRVLQMIASLAPIRRLPGAARAIGLGRPGIVLQFLVLFAIRYTRRKYGSVVRRLQFA